MSYKTCPDWPTLMELAPDLQFKHMAVTDAQLPFDVIARIPHRALAELELCCDLDHHVFYAPHTHPDVVAALAGTHWFDVREWADSAVARTIASALTTPGSTRNATITFAGRSSGPPRICTISRTHRRDIGRGYASS